MTSPDRRPRAASRRCALPPSAARAVAIAAGLDPTECLGSRGRYLVTLGRSIDRTATSFSTSVFTGPGRVDLEDACDWGGYDIVLVQRRSGFFHREEARRILQTIIDDVTYDHPLQFVRIEATRSFLALRLQADFDDHRLQRWPRLRREVLSMLRACRLHPGVLEETPSETTVAIGPSGHRRSLVLVRARRRGGVTRLARLHPGSRFVERPRDSLGNEGMPRGLGYLPFRDLLREFHAARIQQASRGIPAARREGRKLVDRTT